MYITSRGRKGYVLDFALFSVVALLGMAVVTVDLGMLVASRQRVQDSVDAAALAGALHLPAQDEAFYWARECLTANDGQSAYLQLHTSREEDIVFYQSREIVPGYGALGPDIHAVTIRSTGIFEYAFAQALGWQNGQVTCSATAIGKDTGGWGILFVEDLLTNDNAQMQITADVHSNNHINFDGASGFISGDASYVNSLTKDRCTLDFQGSQEQVPLQPRPTDCTASDFSIDYDIIGGDDPPIVGANCYGGDITAYGQTTVEFPPGVYECDNLILRDCGTITGTDVTFVVHNRVVFANNESIQLSSAQHDMTLYATGTDSRTMELDNGGPIEIMGGVCVPDGGIYFDHSELRVTNGVLYSDTLLIDQAGTIVDTVDESATASYVKLIQ